MRIDVENQPMVLLRADGTTVQGELERWEESDSDLVGIALRADGREWIEVAANFWSALRAVRVILDLDQLRPCCYGASRNVHPSAMILEVGTAERAFRLTLGQPGRTADLVDIFDTGPDVMPVAVVEQDAFYDEWTRHWSSAPAEGP